MKMKISIRVRNDDGSKHHKITSKHYGVPYQSMHEAQFAVIDSLRALGDARVAAMGGASRNPSTVKRS